MLLIRGEEVHDLKAETNVTDITVHLWSGVRQAGLGGECHIWWRKQPLQRFSEAKPYVVKAGLIPCRNIALLDT